MLEVNFNPFPILNTERLILRKVINADATYIHQMRSNEIVMKYLDRPRTESVDDAMKFIIQIQEALKNNEGITWAICFKNQPQELLGTIGFWRFEKAHYRAEIGYMLRHEFHRQGIMQEAIEAALHYAFHQTELHSIEAVTNPLNKASNNILLKNGFEQEAYFKENYYWNGTFLDSAVFSLIKKN